MADYTIKQNDTEKKLEATLRDAADVAVDLTGATIVFSMRRLDDRTVVISKQTVTITNPPGTDGKVEYPWKLSETATLGEYEGEFQVTFSGGGVQTFPNDRHIRIRIVDDID